MDLIVLATLNDGKARELALLLTGLAARFESLRAHPGVTLPPETGSTYRENALLKARAVFAALRLPALGDDSGLEVDALAGAPGIHSARYAAEGANDRAAPRRNDRAAARANDRANNEQLLQALAQVPADSRTARFRCVLALVRGPGDEIVVEGTCEGQILDAPRGEGGFGYDPLFLPEDEIRTFAELPNDVKNAMSHRGKAAAALRAALR